MVLVMVKAKEKVKLVFAKSYVQNPTHSDCFAETVEVELPEHINMAYLIGARCYQTEQNAQTIGGDHNASIWEFEDESRLVGKLLTYVEATFTDKEQREAHKNIVKDIVYGFSQEIRTRGVQTVDAYPDKEEK